MSEGSLVFGLDATHLRVRRILWDHGRRRTQHIGMVARGATRLPARFLELLPADDQEFVCLVAVLAARCTDPVASARVIRQLDQQLELGCALVADPAIAPVIADDQVERIRHAAYALAQQCEAILERPSRCVVIQGMTTVSGREMSSRSRSSADPTLG